MLGLQEILLLFAVISIIIYGVFSVVSSKKYTVQEKSYWIVIIILFNVLGVGVFLLDKLLLKRKVNFNKNL